MKFRSGNGISDAGLQYHHGMVGRSVQSPSSHTPLHTHTLRNACVYFIFLIYEQWADGPTDGQKTDGKTDGRIDKSSHRITCPRLRKHLEGRGKVRHLFKVDASFFVSTNS